MRLGPMEINASLLVLWASALWQLAPIDALTARRPCPTPECTKSNLRSFDCNCDVWQKHWSENYKQHYWSNSETGQISFENTLNFEAESQNEDVTTQGLDILNKGGLDGFGKTHQGGLDGFGKTDSRKHRSKLRNFGANSHARETEESSFEGPVNFEAQIAHEYRKPERSGLRNFGSSPRNFGSISPAWERHWSNYQQKYYWINRETGKYSWKRPVEEVESYERPSKTDDLATGGPDILNQGGRTPEECELLNEVEKTWLNLQKNLVTQDEITDYIGCMDSPQAGVPNVDFHVQMTAAEGSPVMAGFLGDMWKEMRMFKNPFLKEQLLEHRMKLKQIEPGLRQEYKAALTSMKRQEEIWANDEDATAEDRRISKRNAALLEEGLLEAEEAESYDEEEDAKRIDDEDDAREAAEEARWEKAPYEEDRDKRAATKTMKRDPKDRLFKPWWMRGMEENEMKYRVDPDDSFDLPAKEGNRKEEKYRVDPDDSYDLPAKSSGEKADVKDRDDEEVMRYMWYWPWTWSWPTWSHRKLEERWKRAELEDQGPPQPKFTEETMPTVSTAVHCVMLLAWVYFIVFTMIAIARTVSQLSNNRIVASLTVQTTLEKVKQHVEAVPVLCVLFLAVRFRAIELTDGDTHAYDLPQPYVQLAMLAAAYGVTFQIIFTLTRIVFFGKVDHTSGHVTYGGEPKPAIILFVAVKYVFLMCIYIGVMAVCIGAINMPTPKELWGDSSPPVSAALTCVVFLSCAYFVVDFVVASLKIAGDDVTDDGGDNPTPRQKANLAFLSTKPALNLVPMLGVLFLVFHTWGLDTDYWEVLFVAEACMYLSSAMMIFQVVFSIALATWVKDSIIEKPALQSIPGIVNFRSDSIQWKTCGIIVRRLSALLIYGGSFTLIIIGHEYAFRAVSATMRCTIGLTFLYFLVLAAIFLVHTQKGSQKGVDCVARTAVLVPMLCLVFMAARIRVLQLTRTTHGDVPAGAAPQGWVQNAMYFSSLAMVLQLFMAYLTGSCAVEDPSILQEEDKRSMSPTQQVAISIAVAMHLCLVFMLFGVLMVMVGVVEMTPETLSPYGGAVYPRVVRHASQLLFPDS